LYYRNFPVGAVRRLGDKFLVYINRYFFIGDDSYLSRSHAFRDPDVLSGISVSRFRRFARFRAADAIAFEAVKESVTSAG